MNSLFKQIVEIPSVSGKEQELKKFIDDELKEYVTSIYSDALGNNIKEVGSSKTEEFDFDNIFTN